MGFKIRNDIRIRSKSLQTFTMKDYDYNDLSSSVAYFVDKIQKLKADNHQIGVMFGFLSFASVSCMLALIKSKVDYTIIYYSGDMIPEDADQYCSHAFLLGPFDSQNNIVNFVNQKPDFFTNVNDPEIEKQIISYHRKDDLIFEFGVEQKIYALMAGNDKVELVHGTGKIEESSISAAMQHYYSHDDYCLLYRPCRHIGVATLSVYPALFKAKTIVLCADKEEWAGEITPATHVHFGFNMIQEKWLLPKKLRILTTGGYSFNSDCINYVNSISEIDQIIDCYGTYLCPPPLAIRELSKIEDNAITPFKWINEFIRPLNINDILYFETSDKVTFQNLMSTRLNKFFESNIMPTHDRIKNIDENTFYFYGRSTHVVRVNHVQWSESSFVQLAYEKTNIKDLKVVFKTFNGVDIPVIKVNSKYKTILEDFVSSNHVEAAIEYE